jgi:hypothetical protein
MYSEILSVILFGTYSGIFVWQLGIYCGILSAIYSGIHSGILFGIYFGILPEVSFWVFLAGILTFFLACV